MTRIIHSTIAALSILLMSCAGAQAPGRADAQQRLQKAQALFNEHCKSSGEFIKRTVDNVEGIYLLKLRPQETNYSNQFKLDDPYGADSGGETYIKTFLHGFHKPSPNYIPGDPLRYGYRYVEATDPKDGRRYRYTGSIKEVTHTSSILMGGDGKTQFKRLEFTLDKTPATGPAPRYGITYDDISTQEDREYWIAGSSLKVIDLQTNEVVAERIGYMMDPGQGSDAGGRQAWLMAADYACPHFERYVKPIVRTPGFSQQANQTDDFTEKVLHPKLEK